MRMLQILRTQKAFSIVELLIAIAIIGLLATITTFAVMGANAKSRDTRRISDLKQIQNALEQYIEANQSIPSPISYGRANVSPGFWDGWWDISTYTTGTTGFMNFLVTSGFMSKVPVDPVNSPAGFNGGPNAQNSSYYYYVYFRVPKTYAGFGGGSCTLNITDIYLIGLKNLETDSARPSVKFPGSNCDCLWNTNKKYFQQFFDYVICGQV